MNNFGKTILKPNLYRMLCPRLLSDIADISELSDFEVQRYRTPTISKTAPIPVSLYGGRHTVTMLPGSGIGPELLKYVVDVFKHVKAPVDFELVETAFNSDTDTDLENALLSIRRNGVAIKGNIETGNKCSTIKLRNVAIRNELDLYVYMIHVKSYPGVRARHEGLDVVVIRQNTEESYSMLEHEATRGVVESLKIMTEANVTRVAKYAFDYARKFGRKKVTIVHKANIMKLSDGLFLEVCRRVGNKYPEIQHDDMIIDNCSMQLVSKPNQFDVLVAPNMYGNIVSNIICGLTGGPGLWSGKNYGGHYAVFEAGTRNMGRLIAGKNTANPVGMLNAAVDMLVHLGHVEQAQTIHKAIVKTICEDKIHTPDLGGQAQSTDVVCRIIDHIKASQ